MAIEVILVGGTMAIERSLLLNQTVRVIIDAIRFTPFVFNVGEQKAMVVVTVPKLAAIRVDLTGEQMKVIVVLIAGFPPLLVNKPGDFVVRIVLIVARPVAREDFFYNSSQAIVPVSGNGSTGVLFSQQLAEFIVTILVERPGGRCLFYELPLAIPAPFMNASIWQINLCELTLGTIVVTGYSPFWIGFAGKVTLSGVFKRPGLAIAMNFINAPFTVSEQSGLAVWAGFALKPPILVVLIFCPGTHGVDGDLQPPLIVVFVQVFGAIRVNFLLQLRRAVVTPDFPAAVHIANRAGMIFVIPLEPGINLGAVTPLMNTSPLG